jgi:predicted HAD superfamily phosphohydrolase YqeG
LIRLFRGPAVAKSVDVLRKVAQKPIAKKLIHQAKKELGKTAANVLADVMDGENIKTSVKKHGISALKNIATAPLKKPKKNKTKSSRGNKRKRSIFDH